MYARPARLDQALGLLSDGGARVMAGMTDLLPAAGESPLQGRFVDVSDLSELRGIALADGAHRLGGATTWSEIARADLPPAFGALQARRARGRLGADPKSRHDRGQSVQRLARRRRRAGAADPERRRSSSPRTRGLRRLAARRFHCRARGAPRWKADEILTAVVVPAPPPTLRSAFLKLGARRYLVISIAMVAAALDVDDGVVRDARIAVGACSAVATTIAAGRTAPRRASRGARPRIGALA